MLYVHLILRILYRMLLVGIHSNIPINSEHIIASHLAFLGSNTKVYMEHVASKSSTHALLYRSVSICTDHIMPCWYQIGTMILEVYQVSVCWTNPHTGCIDTVTWWYRYKFGIEIANLDPIYGSMSFYLQGLFGLITISCTPSKPWHLYEPWFSTMLTMWWLTYLLH